MSVHLEARVKLLATCFLNRTNVLAILPEWGTPCPAEVMDQFGALLRAHVYGELAAAVRVRLRGLRRWVAGRFRLGSYTPDENGNTLWVCLDFDGSNHPNGLADPEAAVIQTHFAFARQGLMSCIEKSGGGQGFHLWVLFNAPVSAAKARQVAFALVPAGFPLANGGVADARRGTGVEVFPKSDTITNGGLGSVVWLPFWAGAPQGANIFYLADQAGKLVAQDF